MLLAVVGFCSPGHGRRPAAGAAVPDTVRVVQDADSTREQLRNILRTYPRLGGEILRRDPSLMSRADYMAPYPQLAQFLAQHPEIPRNVEFYFDGYRAGRAGIGSIPSTRRSACCSAGWRDSWW